MNKKFVVSFLLVATLSLGAGCATTQDATTKNFFSTAPILTVKINSIGSDEPAGKKVVILPLNQKTSPEELQFKEFSAYLSKVLSDKGYTVVPDPRSAQVWVFLGYSISSPREHEVTSAMPMTTYQPGRTTTYTGSGFYGATGTASTSGSYNTTYVPVTNTVVSYTRKITVGALQDQGSKKDPKQLWETTLISTGSSGDLRATFPVMIAAAADHIGTNTRQALPLDIAFDDPRVLNLTGQDLDRVPANQ